MASWRPPAHLVFALLLSWASAEQQSGSIPSRRPSLFPAAHPLLPALSTSKQQLQLAFAHSLARLRSVEWRPSLALGERSARTRRRPRDADDPLERCGHLERYVREMTDTNDEWELRSEKDGVRIWRRHVAGSPYAEVRGNGLIDAPPAVVLALLQLGDAETIRKYNPMYESGYDLQLIDAQTKISFGEVKAVFPLKPRDTVTRIAVRDVPGLGGTALILRCAEHPQMPPRSTHVRAQILRGMHYVQPVSRQPGRTNFTFTSQVNAGGAVPAWLMNGLVVQDSVSFIQRLDALSRKRAKRRTCA